MADVTNAIKKSVVVEPESIQRYRLDIDRGFSDRCCFGC